jgi:uncharacterized membrane protein
MSTSPTKSSTGLPSNVAGALCYLLGPLTGIVFLLVEKEDRFVRFHAAHSIIVGVAVIGISVLLTVFTAILSIVPILGTIIGILISLAVWLGLFAFWLFLMFQAFSGREWEAPVVGQYAWRLIATPAPH